jgi:hypothetical protein
VDECKEWSDRATAIASYARQRKDRSLMEMAKRIKLRASVRIGELLNKIPVQRHVIRKGHREIRNASRRTAGRMAGLSLHTIQQLCRMADVPREVREFLIEQSPPINPRELAGIATKRVAPIKGFKAGIAYREVTNAVGGSLGAFCGWIQKHPAAELARQLSADEATVIRHRLVEATEWLDEFESNLGSTAQREVGK